MKKLNVGSGFNPLPHFDNCDINPACKDLTFVCPLDDLPVPVNTYDELWSIHSIEHVPVDGARKALAEWYRVVKPGGFIHVDTPNVERNIRLYLNNDWMRDFNILTPKEQEMVSIDGVPNKTLWLNFKMFSSPQQWDIHYWNADAELLQLLCTKAGFSRTEVYQTEPSLIVRAYK
jgi:predicted SAM-dependent methyltransferase